MTGPQAPSQSPKGYALYADYIKQQIDAQEARKSSLEQRGLAVISTSGALVTLLFGLTALTVKRGATFDLPETSSTFLVFALIGFVVAALLALITNLPRSYQGVKVEALKTAVKNRWHDSEPEAARMIALTMLNTLASSKNVNNQKGLALIAAMGFEVVAVALGGIAMGYVLWGVTHKRPTTRPPQALGSAIRPALDDESLPVAVSRKLAAHDRARATVL